MAKQQPQADLVATISITLQEHFFTRLRGTLEAVADGVVEDLRKSIEATALDDDPAVVVERDVVPQENSNKEQPLALRSKEVAKRLNISDRKLWELVASGQIPHMRLGSVVLFPVDTLRAWLAKQAKKSMRGRV